MVVVSPNSQWNWIPSNIWVGVGKMTAKQVLFPLAPIYRKQHIEFRQALATTLFPEGTAENPSPAVEIRYTDPKRKGQTERLTYDYLVNATGPEAQLRRHAGPRPGRRQLPLRLYRRARRAHGRGVREGDRETRGGRAADPGDRHRPRDVHLRGRGVRVHVQRGARAARARRPRQGGRHLPEQRVRAGRLRRRRNVLHAAGLHHVEQDVDRVPVPGARRQGDHPGARAARGARA